MACSYIVLLKQLEGAARVMQGVSTSGEAAAVLAHIALEVVHCRRDNDTSAMQAQGYLLDNQSWSATCASRLGTKLLFVAASTRLACVGRSGAKRSVR